MRSFADHNPVAVAVYFLATAGIAMFCMDPLLLLISLVGALICHGLCTAWRNKGIHLFTLLLFVAMTLLNPLISHRGATVLFVMNHNPVTLEALYYGAAASGMIVSVMYWFRTFTHVMTSDKLLYLFGALSPKLSLILSMTLRYVPLFGQQARKVRQSQQALGLYKEDNIIDRFRGGLRIFSVMVTWALENGIVTADSMTARGYGISRRSHFSLFRWTRGDVLLLLSSLVLCISVLACLWGRTVVFYPRYIFPALTHRAAAGYALYALLTLLPAMIQGKEALRWHCLKSSI